MRFDELESYMLTSAKHRGISGYCIIIHKGGKEIYKKSYTAPDEQCVFDGASRHWIYSMTKPVTALMGVILLEKGIIGLNDELSKYFPESKEMLVKKDGKICKAENKILLKHLFNMTAGFGYDIFSPAFRDAAPDAPTSEIVERLLREPLDFEPGTAYQYSFCFDILAAVYEKATGVKISELYKENIFDKLGMKKTSFEYTDDTCPMYYLTDKNKVQGFGNINYYVPTEKFDGGGAGLISTPDDYIKFADLLSNGGVLPNGERLISQSSVELFYKHYLDSEILDRLSPFTKKGYSYGFGCRSLITKKFGAKSPFGEFGWDGAAGSYVLMDTVNRLSIVYMQDLLYEKDTYDVFHPKIRDLTYKELLSHKEAEI